MAASAAANARDYVIVDPLGSHTATIVWLHGRDPEGLQSSRYVESLALRHIKWICISSTYGSGVVRTPLAEIDNGLVIPRDVTELDSAVQRVAELLANEPENVVIGVGGFGRGGNVALRFATLCALGEYDIRLGLVIGIESLIIMTEDLKRRIRATNAAATRAASLAILLIPGPPDPRDNFDIQRCVERLREAGFSGVSPRLGSPINVYIEVKNWLIARIPVVD